MNKYIVSFLALAFAPALASAAPQVTTAAGAAPADIQAAVAAFRQTIGIGGPGNTTNGPFADGLRNINWDGAPDTVSSPNAMPGDFFNNNVRRGAVFTTPGTRVEMSADSDNPTLTPVRFAHLEPSYATRFQAFSAQRLFAAIGSTIIDTDFFVPGSPATPATVNGFGVVFCDVDLPDSTSIEFFDAAGVSLGRWYAPVADNGLSFLGVFFPDGERVATARVTHGNLALGAGQVDTGTLDVVATDDFMFGEPIPTGADARFLNVSSRGRVGAGEDVLITGFVVGGTQPKAVLIRAIGPLLGTVGVANPLADPLLTVYNGAGQMIATNNDWGNKPEVAQAAVRVGAGALPAGSADSALIVVLNPGVYSMITSGVGGATGVAVNEVFELP